MPYITHCPCVIRSDCWSGCIYYQNFSIAHQNVSIDVLCDVISVYWSVPLVWVRNMAGVPSPHRVIILPHTPSQDHHTLVQSREVGGGGVDRVDSLFYEFCPK